MDKQQDTRLDIPSEANREKHINFMEAEERASGGSADDQSGSTKEDKERRKEWEQGLEEGRKAAQNDAS
jgi:hypothetical protein